MSEREALAAQVLAIVFEAQRAWAAYLRDNSLPVPYSSTYAYQIVELIRDYLPPDDLLDAGGDDE